MDAEPTAVHARPRFENPEPELPKEPPKRTFEESLRSELAVRVRIGGLALALAAALSIPLSPETWPVPAATVVIGAVASLLPRALRESLAEALAIGIGVCAVASAAVPVGPNAFSVPLLASVLMALLLPTRQVSRALTLLVHAGVILLINQPALLELPLVAIGLGAAFYFGHIQISHWRTMWTDKEKLAGLTHRLEQQSARQELMLTRREEELLQQQDKMVLQEKWATLGRVATGIAHEIKNPLQAAFTDLDTARRTGDLALLEDIEVSLRRIEQIAHDVSRLRGTNVSEVAAYDLKPLLRASMRSARMGLKSLQLVEGAIPPVVVSCNQNLLVEVLANLLTNSSHATERRGRGKVLVHATLTAHKVLIYVDDDGPGIPKGAEDRVFETFVTTKPAGKGTGLGLPISRSKLQSMGGDLWAEQNSELGGARMVIALQYAPSDAERAPIRSPSSAPARRHHPQPENANSPGSATQRHHGTLLLIDDDRNVRRALSRTLEREWRVLLASGSREARALAKREPVNVVLCDMHLLQEDAVDVLLALDRVDRTLASRTVFMSGEPTSSRLLALAEGNPDRMISKPFDPRTAVAKLLAARDGQLPMLERVEDAPTPPSIGALEPVWSFEAPTEEITFDE